MASVHSYFVRITRPYSDLSGMIALWAERCEKLVVYEHVGTKTEKVHIHVLIVNSQVEKKMLKTLGLSNGYNLKGNQDWSWKIRKDVNMTPMIYMTKGIYLPSFLKGYTMEDAEEWKSLWKEDEKLNIWEQIVNYVLDDEYIDQCWNFEKERMVLKEGEEAERFFAFFLKYARKMVFTKNKMIWSPSVANQYKCVVMTYIMRKGLKVPDAYKEWKKFMEF